MGTIYPVNQNFPLVDERGTCTQESKRYLDQLLARVGGTNGGSLQPLTDAPVIAWDADRQPVAAVVLGGNRLLALPTNLVAGNLYPYRLTVAQDGVGGRTLSWATGYRFPGGTPPTLPTGANRISEFWFSSDGTTMNLITGALNLS